MLKRYANNPFENPGTQISSCVEIIPKSFINFCCIQTGYTTTKSGISNLHQECTSWHSVTHWYHGNEWSRTQTLLGARDKEMSHYYVSHSENFKQMHASYSAQGHEYAQT